MSDREYDEAWQTDSMKEWAEHVLNDTKPKMESSALICQLLPKDGIGDVKFWCELGASVMMDKPIIAVAFSDREIPPKLRMIADEVVVLPEGVTPEASDELAEAFERVLGIDK